MDRGADDWLQPLAELVARRQHGGVLLALPEYRPDLARAIADVLGFSFFDVRADILMPRGWDAAKVTVEEMADALMERAGDMGVVAHNVEALLATKEKAVRQCWLERFLRQHWPHPIVVPLFLFIHEASPDSPQLLHLAAEDLPSETLLGQLRFWGG